MPKTVREQLSLREGDKVLFRIQEDTVTLVRIKPLLELKGSVPVDGPQDLEGVRERALELYAKEIATGSDV